MKAAVVSSYRGVRTCPVGQCRTPESRGVTEWQGGGARGAAETEGSRGSGPWWPRQRDSSSRAAPGVLATWGPCPCAVTSPASGPAWCLASSQWNMANVMSCHFCNYPGEDSDSPLAGRLSPGDFAGAAASHQPHAGVGQPPAHSWSETQTLSSATPERLTTAPAREIRSAPLPGQDCGRPQP